MLIKRLKLIILLSLTASGAMMFASSEGAKAQDEALCKDDALNRELTAFGGSKYHGATCCKRQQ